MDWLGSQIPYVATLVQKGLTCFSAGGSTPHLLSWWLVAVAVAVAAGAALAVLMAVAVVVAAVAVAVASGGDGDDSDRIVIKVSVPEHPARASPRAKGASSLWLTAARHKSN